MMPLLSFLKAIHALNINFTYSPPNAQLYEKRNGAVEVGATIDQIIYFQGQSVELSLAVYTGSRYSYPPKRDSYYTSPKNHYVDSALLHGVVVRILSGRMPR